jgi:glutamate-1-semialdehyde 2,1-aminomutase
VLRYLKENPSVYEKMADVVNRLRTSILEIAAKYALPYQINGVTGMFTGFFSREPVTDYESALKADRVTYERFFKAMLEEGVFFAPSPFEASIITFAHREAEISKTIETYEKVFKALAS